VLLESLRQLVMVAHCYVPLSPSVIAVTNQARPM